VAAGAVGHTGVRVRELLEPLGCTAGKTVVDDYLREVRPLFAPPPRTFQRTSYRPGEICQVDVWQPRQEVPVGHGQTRQEWVVVACLGYSRAGAGVLVFSKETEDLLAGIAGCIERLGALPKELVWDRQAGIHGYAGKPSEAFAAFCGQLDEVGYIPFDPQAANLMFMLVSRRCERASRIVTSNKPFSAWGEIFGDEITAAAMIDRLVHHAEILALKGDSYRLEDRDLARPTPASRTVRSVTAARARWGWTCRTARAARAGVPRST
jgi:hypothetical protein